MPDYAKTIIYKIICNDDTVTDIYVGHTSDFNRRQREHKSKCNNKNSKDYNFIIYRTIRDNGGWNNWSIIKVEQFPCENKTEAIAREGHWYNELNGTLNKQIPSRTRKEYYQDTKEEILGKKKEKMVCECGSSFRKCAKTRHLKSTKHLNFIGCLI